MYPCYIERMWTCNIFMQDRKRVFFPILYMLLRVFFSSSCFFFHSPDFPECFCSANGKNGPTNGPLILWTNSLRDKYYFISPVAHSFLPVEQSTRQRFDFCKTRQFFSRFFFLKTEHFFSSSFTIFWHCMWCDVNWVAWWCDCIGLIWLRQHWTRCIYKHKYIFSQCTKCISNYCYTFLFFCSLTVDIDSEATSRRL